MQVWIRKTDSVLKCSANIEIKSLSMRGAQREVTGYLIGEGYIPITDWITDTKNEISGREFVETPPKTENGQMMNRIEIPADATPIMKLAMEMMNDAISDLYDYDGYTASTHEFRVNRAEVKIRAVHALLGIDDMSGGRYE